jgi:hypothetical protein
MNTKTKLPKTSKKGKITLDELIKHDEVMKRSYDTTQKRRQSKRTAQLNAKAQAKGWTGISEYLTAIINDEQQIPSKSAI